MGVKVLRNTTLNSIQTNHSNGDIVKFVNILEGPKPSLLRFDHPVISAGPWSQRVLEKLFPEAQFRIPLNLTWRLAITCALKTPRWAPKDDELGCDQLYMADILGHTLDISSFLGGTLYVGGYGADPQVLPELSTDVLVQPDAVKAILKPFHWSAGQDEQLQTTLFDENNKAITPRFGDLPKQITLEGGENFFAPSISALLGELGSA
ncbi:hypothetical protein GP486_005228 [Trichoglossum hirsutum]|uniref:FAD dependent oxidoreductase domain-containing protein n=1 Tax=Trichoglossum hirsutum TaxID=265104 RepID=A0A9P8L9H1_9PEZI|nr:hypothetical protein GP486_005228 [Trichoglossum hirsutum]